MRRPPLWAPRLAEGVARRHKARNSPLVVRARRQPSCSLTFAAAAARFLSINWSPRGSSGLLRAWRILSRRARRARRRADRGDGLPPGGGRGDDGADRRPADRPPRRLLRHPGPGATNAAHGVHIAEHDSAPLVLFVGQVERAMRRARRVSGDGLSRAVRLDHEMGDRGRGPGALPEIIQRAFHVAMQGRPGPVVIALPEDVLIEMASVADAPRAEAAPIWPGQTQMAELQKMLWAARSPDRHPRRRRLERARRRGADAFCRAVRSAARRLVPPRERRRQRSRQFRRRSRARRQSQAEGAHRGRRSRAADWRAHGGDALARLHAVRHSRAAPGAGPCSRRRRRDRPHLSSAPRRLSPRPRPFAPRSKACSRPTRSPGARRRARRAPSSSPGATSAPANPGPVQLGEIMLTLRRARARGDLRQWRGQFRLCGRAASCASASFNQQLGPVSGSMGFGVPAAVAAKRAHPGAHSRRLLRRRRFSDERSGIRHRRAI